MSKQLLFCIVLLAGLIGFVIWMDSGRQKPVDWTPSYAIRDTRPLGLEVLNKEAEGFFGKGKLTKFGETPYQFLEPKYDYEKEEYTPKGTLMHISQFNMLDEESVTELLYYADHGNSVFLSMNHFPEQLLDSLIVVTGNQKEQDSVRFLFTDERAGQKEYDFKEGISTSYFDTINANTTAVLGRASTQNYYYTHFIKVAYGKGSFLLHTQPAVFTNYYLLKKENYEYAQKLLSHIKPGNVYWYDRQFPGGGSSASSSSLRYVMKQPALTSAFFIGLLGIIVFMFFNARRKQRIIPEIAPLRNTTIDFAKTIGNLYYQEGSHHTIIEKKIIYLLEKIRNEYLIDTYSLDEEFIEKLHLKTGRPKEDIENLVQLIQNNRHRFNSTDADVIEINNAIEKLML